MVAAGGHYYLFYSGNNWKTASYAIGYAVCRTPQGGCVKATTTRPWVLSDAHKAGPGGESFFTDSAGATSMAYHAWTPGKVSYESGGVRSLWIDPVVFTPSGPQLR
jgi:hypothetical protein